VYFLYVCVNPLFFFKNNKHKHNFSLSFFLFFSFRCKATNAVIGALELPEAVWPRKPHNVRMDSFKTSYYHTAMAEKSTF